MADIGLYAYTPYEAKNALYMDRRRFGLRFQELRVL